MKILFTSVGRRVELMQAFKAAAEKNGIDLTIYGADMSKTAPALYFCDEQVMVPAISSPEYIETLLDICKKNGIDALIPTIDTDLMLLAENRFDFERAGTKVYISAKDKVALCRDKRFTADYFESIGLKSPHPIDDINKYNSGFPAFIKPKDGSSSISAYRADNPEMLAYYAKQVPDYIIQPFITGTEYTVDIFCNYDGEPVYITPRIRMAVRSGEVMKTKIVQDERIIEEMQQFIADFKPCGAATVQLIRDAESGDDHYIEINPRFGGGAPLSMKAGADEAEALLFDVRGDKLTYKEKAAEDGAIYSRFDQSVRIG